MRLFFSLIIIVIIFSSCARSIYYTSINVQKEMPAMDSKKPLYLFSSPENILPDSTIFIGTFKTEFKAVITFNYGYMENIFTIYNDLDNLIKNAGGNLALIEKVDNSTEKILKGKVYLINDAPKTDFTEDSIMKLWETRKPDRLEGIYQMKLSGFGDKLSKEKGTYAIVRLLDSSYIMVYLHGYDRFYFDPTLIIPVFDYLTLINLQYIWNEGDVKAYIKRSEKPNVFLSKRFEYNKFLEENSILKYDDGNLNFSTNSGTDYYRKIYPDSSVFENRLSSLTGFAIDKNHIVTCYHGLIKENENSRIYVKGINGNIEKKYRAVVEKYDRSKDIAVLKLDNPNATINIKPFPIADSPKNTAEEVFVLGYPISNLMGEEIKVTNGIISATTGAAGNMYNYQISAPVQPGNIGSPLFDKTGNFIGMVTSKSTSANNVAYSLKFKIIKEFLENNGYKMQCQPENTYKDLNLSQKVNTLQDMVYLIEIIDITPDKSD